MSDLYSKKDGEKVWNAFKQMHDYIDKSYQVIVKSDSNNNYTNQKGKVMYDGVSTLLNTNVGHQNQEIIEEISKQLTTLENTSLFTCTDDVAIACSKKLCELSENHFYSAFFTNSGSEACDTAIKIVLKYWNNLGDNRRIIVSLKGAYHGSSIGAMMLAHEGYSMDDYGIPYDSFHQTPVPDPLERPENLTQEEWVQECVDAFENYCKEKEGKIAAIFMELIQLSNAVNVLPLEFVQKIYNICKEHNILIVIDEVATGFGRTGTLFASQYYGIWGDLMMVAKGITSGYIPMGGVLVTKDVFYNFYGKKADEKILEHGFTTGGHPVACAAAIKNIEQLLENKYVDNSETLGTYLLNGLQASIGDSKLVECIRGKGLMISIIFKDIQVKNMEEWGIAELLTNFLINKGLLLYPDDKNILIIAPCLNCLQSDCDMIIEKIQDSVKKVEFLVQ